MAAATPQEQLAQLVDRLLGTAGRALDGLTVDQINDTAGRRANSPGFDVWHVVRTADNVIHFVFDRDQPVWLRDGYNERWRLPKVDQGTGMDVDAAYDLRFPAAADLAGYTAAVREAIVPRIRSMSDDYLAETVKIVPFGEMPRMEVIGQVLVSHGNGHLGRIDHARALLGLDGLGF